MRLACFECAKKHLGQASALIIEAELGYPLHKWLAVGHLAEAEAELIKDHKDLAIIIRDARLKYIKGEQIDILDLLGALDDDGLDTNVQG